MISRELSEGVAEWLGENRPAEYLEAWGIRGESGLGDKLRPLSVVVVEKGENMGHPKMKRFPLSLRGEYLPKAVVNVAGVDVLEQEGFPAGFAKLDEVLADKANFQSLREALSVRGLLLRRLVRGDDDEFEFGETARRIEVGYSVVVEVE